MGLTEFLRARLDAIESDYENSHDLSVLDAHAALAGKEGRPS